MELPASFDPFRAAAVAEEMMGEVAAASFQRLADSVRAILDETIEVDLRFGTEAGAKATLHGKLRARVELECQRCLEPMAYPLEADIHLAFIRYEAEQEGLPEELEPLLVEGDGLDLRALVEDELILALPLVPMHPQICRKWQDPEAKTDAAEPEKENPFSVLAKLKQDN
jgi:uncharacterized protein